VGLEPADVTTVQQLLKNHMAATGSDRARWVLDNWNTLQSKFVKVYPRDYRRVLESGKIQAPQIPVASAR